MAFKVNKVLEVPNNPFRRSVETAILRATEEFLGQKLDWVEHRELKGDGKVRRFLVEKAYNMRDK